MACSLLKIQWIETNKNQMPSMPNSIALNILCLSLNPKFAAKKNVWKLHWMQSSARKIEKKELFFEIWDRTNDAMCNIAGQLTISDYYSSWGMRENKNSDLKYVKCCVYNEICKSSERVKEMRLFFHLIQFSYVNE